ncbi:MAG: RNA 2'-phosphotransferase [Eubacteriales bacterium]|nr:RNA 2'-phosphotransferase [Eubacteriales bacterium]
MAGKKNVTLGKFISKILRHEPGLIGIRVDEHGWADVEELIAGIQAAGHPEFDMAALEEIVETNNKQRYSFSSDKRLIRANQGHSIPVDVELPATSPPDTLWHGTADRFVPSIMEKGILRMSRLYVHLSPDEETARIVGRRHGRPVILRVDAGQMEADGYVFYLSANGVWLTTEVPVKYITVENNRD